MPHKLNNTETSSSTDDNDATVEVIVQAENDEATAEIVAQDLPSIVSDNNHEPSLHSQQKNGFQKEMNIDSVSDLSDNYDKENLRNQRIFVVKCLIACFQEGFRLTETQLKPSTDTIDENKSPTPDEFQKNLIPLFQLTEKIYTYIQKFRIIQSNLEKTIPWKEIFQTVDPIIDYKSSIKINESTFQFTHVPLAKDLHLRVVCNATKITGEKKENYIVKIIKANTFQYTEHAMLSNLGISIEEPVFLGDKKDEIALFMENRGVPITTNIFEIVRGWQILNKLKLINNIIEKLTYLHLLDIIHCDIKGKNLLLLLSEDNEKKESAEITLIDFGASKYTDSSNPKIAGTSYTPAYAPKEAFLGYKTKETDYFSLTSILVDILKSPRSTSSLGSQRDIRSRLAEKKSTSTEALPFNDSNLCDTTYLSKKKQNNNDCKLSWVKPYIKQFLSRMAAENIEDRPSATGTQVKDFFEILAEFCELAYISKQPTLKQDIAKLKLALITANIWDCPLKTDIEDKHHTIHPTKDMLSPLDREAFNTFYMPLEQKGIERWKEKDFFEFLVNIEKRCATMNRVMVTYRQQQLNNKKSIKNWEFTNDKNKTVLTTLISLDKKGFFLNQEKCKTFKAMIEHDCKLDQEQIIELYKKHYPSSNTSNSCVVVPKSPEPQIRPFNNDCEATPRLFEAHQTSESDATPVLSQHRRSQSGSQIIKPAKSDSMELTSPHFFKNREQPTKLSERAFPQTALTRTSSLPSLEKPPKLIRHSTSVQ